MAKKRIRVTVEGHVQGVGFRWFTVRAARNLGLVGWVRNNADGSVEAVAEGDSESIREFIGELRRGPMSAVVRDVRWIEESPVGEFSSFGLEY